MSQPISFTVEMNSPCNENWKSMELTEQGRFCNKCQKTVTDFTDATDQEIMQYFLKQPFPICGRMLTSQQARTFTNSKPKNNRNLVPVAASLLTLAAVTTEATPTSPLRMNLPQAQLPYYNQKVAIPADSLLISGTVKNEQGVLLENVEVIFEHFKTMSDQNGNFRFTVPVEFNKPSIIQFSYPNLEKVVRSYHPSMGSSNYNITMYKPYFAEYVVMGNIRPVFHLPDPFSTLTFQTSNKLDSKTKAFLDDLANYIKNNFYLTFTIRSYYNISKQRAVKISNLIKSYLVDAQGIAEERIHLSNPQLRKKNKSAVVIEFSDYNENE